MWAIAFLAVDPRQVEEPYGSYVVIEGTYLVREDWAARTVGDLDAAGNRIAVAEAVPTTCP
jgi:hypothetical protein